MLESARPEDRETVEALARQVHRLHVAWRPDLYVMPEELYPACLYNQALEQKSLFVARLEGLVAGYLRVRRLDAEGNGLVPRRELVVEELCVREDLRGQGIGTRMLQEAAVLAKAFGCTSLRLGTYPQNEEALAFYQKLGFTVRSVTLEQNL